MICLEFRITLKSIIMQAWRGTASDRARVPQHAAKIILGALLSRTLGLKIARLILIFNLVLVLHAPHPKKSVLL